jgi:hypothetical protein
MMKTKRLLLVILSLVPLAGCGYALVGRSMNISPDIKRIGVPLFKDMTGRAQLDQKITEKVIEELLKRGKFQVLQTATDVDALVEGELVSFIEQPVGYGTDPTVDVRAQASRYQITVSARVKYSKVGTTEPIWSSDGFSFSDNYDIEAEGGSFLDSDQAVDRLATQFARQLVAEMLEAF